MAQRHVAGGHAAVAALTIAVAVLSTTLPLPVLGAGSLSSGASAHSSFVVLPSDQSESDWGLVELRDAASPRQSDLLRWKSPFVDQQPITVTWLAAEAATGREWDLTDATASSGQPDVVTVALPPHLRWADISSVQLWVGGQLVATADLAATQASAAAARRTLLQDGGGGGDEPTGIAAWNPRTHGYVAAISFGLAMPLTAVISRCFREFTPYWFWLHMPLGVAAVIGGLLGVIFGAKLPQDGLRPTVLDAHKALGGIALAFAGLQITALVLRPRLDHPKRYLFNHFHHNCGRLAVGLGIVNVYLGLHLADELAKFFWGFTIVLGAIILLWVAKEVLDFVRISAANRRAIKDGYEGARLPGGYPMNGGFAASYLQRPPPAGSRIPLRGHGIRAVADAENPAAAAAPPGAAGHKGGKGEMYANSNQNSTADLLRVGEARDPANVEMTFAH